MEIKQINLDTHITTNYKTNSRRFKALNMKNQTILANRNESMSNLASKWEFILEWNGFLYVKANRKIEKEK